MTSHYLTPPCTIRVHSITVYCTTLRAYMLHIPVTHLRPTRTDLLLCVRVYIGTHNMIAHLQHGHIDGETWINTARQIDARIETHRSKHKYEWLGQLESWRAGKSATNVAHSCIIVYLSNVSIFSTTHDVNGNRAPSLFAEVTRTFSTPWPDEARQDNLATLDGARKSGASQLLNPDQSS